MKGPAETMLPLALRGLTRLAVAGRGLNEGLDEAATRSHPLTTSCTTFLCSTGTRPNSTR